MARITHVKSARQRFEMVPVLDGTGQPVRTPVMRADGTQKASKRGLQFMTVTKADKTKPLAPLDCEFCGGPIEVGQAYKWIQPKSGPYGGVRRNRHEGHPNWEIWDYSNSLAARVAQIQASDIDVSDLAEADEATDLISQVAEEIRALAEEKREAAQNIEDGFQHETEQSSELNEIADNLESWADEGDNIDLTDPEPEEEDCSECGGAGTVDQDCAHCKGAGETEKPDGEMVQCGDCAGDGQMEEDCTECEGTGTITPDDPSEETLDEWRGEIQQAIEDWLGNCPV